MAKVDLPVPPFWFPMTTTWGDNFAPEDGTTDLRITCSYQLWQEKNDNFARLPEPSIGPEIVTVHSHIMELTS